MSLTVFPTIVYNAGTGSDAAASGAGPGTAVTGSAAAHTGGAASTTITFTNSPNLSGVAQDGSAVLWLKTASGRQSSRISTVDNAAKTAVVEDSFNIASGSAVDYAIGGKRATWDQADSRKLFTADVKAGWTVSNEDDQTISSAISLVNAGDFTTGAVNLTGATGGIRTITQSASAAHFTCNGGFWRWKNFKYLNSNATKTSANVFTSGQGTLVWQDCTFGDATTNKINRAMNGTSGTLILAYFNCEIVGTASDGITCNQAGIITCIGTRIRNAGAAGINNSGTASVEFIDGLITGCATRGITVSQSGGINFRCLLVTNSVIHGNTTDGIGVTTAQAGGSCVVIGNNITGNGGWGINGPSGGERVRALLDFNNYGTGGTANTSGGVTGFTAGAHDLTVDPAYTNAAGGDFSAGTNVKAKGYPDSTVALGNGTSATFDYTDIGVQRQEAGGGTAGARLVGPSALVSA